MDQTNRIEQKNDQKNKKDLILMLSNDPLIEILQYTDIKSLIQICKTNKRLYKIFKFNIIWQHVGAEYISFNKSFKSEGEEYFKEVISKYAWKFILIEKINEFNKNENKLFSSDEMKFLSEKFKNGINISVVGYYGVGKTSSIIQFIQNKFIEDLDKIYENFHTKQVKIFDNNFFLNILDKPSLNEEFSRYNDSFMRTTHLYILIYSIIDESSFNDVKRFIEIIERVHWEDELPVLLVGNKVDLSKERVVLKKSGLELAEKYKFAFIESCAKDYEIVEVIFKMALKELFKFTLKKLKEESLKKKDEKCNIS